MTTAIEVKNLTKRYRETLAVDDVSFTIEKDTIYGLLGRNGAGKTTTMKSVMGLAEARRGEILYEGRPIRGLAAFAIARLGIGYVPEERRIFKQLTVMENLEVGRREPLEGARVWELDELFTLFPNLAERRENLGGHLSGGEQQMLTIARTLMGAPKTVLLDEPSEGVAPVIVEQMAHTIEALKAQGLAVLLSEQNVRFAERVSDRACIIESGRIQFDGAMAELAARPEVREQYLAL